ncbi:MAG: cytochrome c peroxidase, partial [Planctomycetota bacterium]
MSTLPTPLPANLSEFVVDTTKAIELGKALFWDSQRGSDGATACATCHFSGGSDTRDRNQAHPGALG